MSLMAKVIEKAGVSYSATLRETSKITVENVVPQPKLSTFLDANNNVVPESEAVKEIKKLLVSYRIIDDKGNKSGVITDIINENYLINPVSYYGGIHATGSFKEFSYTHDKPAREITDANGTKTMLPAIKAGDKGVGLYRVEIDPDNIESILKQAAALGLAIQVRK